MPGATELCFVAEQDEQLVGQVLYTRALLDAPQRLISVLVLSPIGVVTSHTLWHTIREVVGHPCLSRCLLEY
jgi:predicted N-acetyltransferase YhbS